MADEQKAKRLEIAHVLFMDIVGYSKLLTDEQSEALQELNRIVRSTEAAREAEAIGGLTVLPTGDGMALVFTGSVEEPVECALEISQALRAQPSLPLRMGIHSGPIHHVKDANGRENIAGIGINIAQRVMDCGDAGHILVSKRVADDLAQQRRWQPYIHELGDVEVKHGVVVSLVNLYAETIGNPTPPSRLGKIGGSTRTFSKATRKGLSQFARAIFIIVGLVIALIFVLCIVSVIFAPAIMRTLDQRRSATLPQPTATALPSLADTIKSAVAKKITEELQDELSRKKNAAVEPSPSGSMIPEKSIAVLPFENLSEDKSNAYFAEGIQDEILTRLSKIADLKVISRTSTQKYKSAPDNLRDVGQQLGVANLLEGSVQKIANAVHINVQLIRAATDEHVWAESYNRKLDDVFGVEGEVASAIADQLNAKLTGAEQKAVTEKPTQNPAAYDAYLRGLAFAHHTDELDLNITKSIVAFEEVVRLDPRFGAAWAWLSQQHAYAYLRGDHSPSQKEAARTALETAIRLTPDAAETLTAQGFYRYRIERDYNGAREIFQRLREKSPNDPQATWALAAIARRQGRWDESLKLYEQAIVISPRDGQTLNNAADTALAMRDWPAAQHLVDHALDISPGDPGALRRQVNLLQEKGEVERAQKILDGMTIAPGDTDAVYAFVTNAALTHAYAPAIALLKSQLEKPETLGVNLGNFQELLADMQRLAGDAQVAKTSYQQARSTLKTALRVQPDSQELLSGLAAAEAGLGNQAEALAMARHAIELLPASKDAYIGPNYEESLARFQARFGDRDSAISALRHLLSISYGYPPLTVAMLRLDPDFDNLRGDPRFEKLCQEPKK